jgi:hemoglobin
MSDEHFDAVAAHIKASLEALGIAADLVGEAMTIIEASRNDVLNR